MNGIDEILAVFDTSGSFHEPGKQHVLEYLGDTVANAENMEWFQARLRIYTWNDEVLESEDIPPALSGHGIADVRALKKFLEKVADYQAVLLISDGLFGPFRDKKLTLLTQHMGRRFQVVVAGYDADTSTLKKLTGNVHQAEDITSILHMLAKQNFT